MSQAVSFRTFSANAPTNYERYFVPVISRPLAIDLVTAAAPRPGERVLDIGCGTGIVARLVREAVGSDGSVAGVDINPGMLAVAEQLLPSTGGFEWYRAGADGLPLPDGSFDLALMQLSLQFFPDRLAALREAHRVLRAGGRLAINVPGPTPTLFAVMEKTLQRYVGQPAAAFVDTVFSLHDTAEVRDLFVAAGFVDIDVTAATARLSLPAPADFLWQYVHSTPLASVVAGLDEQTLAVIEDEVVEGWRPLTHGPRLPLEVRMVTALGRR